MRKRKVLFHPFLIGLIPALYLFTRNADRLEPADLIASIFVIFGLTCLTWLVSNWLFRDGEKSAILTSLLLLLFFSYQDIVLGIRSFLAAIGLGDGTIQIYQMGGNATVSIIVWASIVFALYFLIAKAKKIVPTIGQFMSYLSVLTVIVIAVMRYQPQQTNSEPLADFESYWTRILSKQPKLTPVGGVRPDIYWIILDAYARQDTLEDYYGFDNSRFLNSLEDRGFYVAQNAHTNYIWTYLSLTSTMNSLYFNDMSAMLRNNPSWSREIDLITEKSILFEQMRHLGYAIITFSDPYELLDIRSADIHVEPEGFRFNEFENELINKTPLPDIFHASAADLQYDQHRQLIEQQFTKIGEFPSIEEPTITFAHILMPHPPFIFDADGKPLQADDFYSIRDGDRYFEPQERQEYVNGFVPQTIYTNKRVLEVIDKIINSSSSPPIIIIQSDHGPASSFDPFNVENTNLTERFGILEAFYFPDRNYGALYQRISPANIFRVVFNQYFGADLQLVPDRSYFSGLDDLLAFSDVTEEVNSDAPQSIQTAPVK